MIHEQIEQLKAFYNLQQDSGQNITHQKSQK